MPCVPVDAPRKLSIHAAGSKASPFDSSLKLTTSWTGFTPSLHSTPSTPPPCLPPWQMPTGHPGSSATVQDGVPGLFPPPSPTTFAWPDFPRSPVLYLDLTMVFTADTLMGASDSSLLNFFTCLRLISLFAFSLCSQTLICSSTAFFFHLVVDCVFFNLIVDCLFFLS